EVLTFDKTEVLEAETERCQKFGKSGALTGTDNTDYGSYRLLRTRNKRPHRRRATDDRDELAPSHCRPGLRRRHRTDSNRRVEGPPMPAWRTFRGCVSGFPARCA